MTTESIEKIQDDVLQRYLDGDLPADEMRRVEALLATSPEDVAELERYRRLGELLRVASVDMQERPESMGERAAPDALFARIEAEIGGDAEAAAPPPATRPPLRAIEGGRGRRRVATGVVLAMAAAAAVWLVARSGMAPGTPGEGPIAHEGETGSPTEPVVAALHRGSEVLDVDFAKSTGTIFNVEGSMGQPLAVVWIDDPIALHDPLGGDKEPQEATQ